MSNISKSNIIIIESVYSGSSVGKFLSNFFSLPFSLISKLLRTKKIKVNNTVIKDSKFALSENDKLEIFYQIKSENTSENTLRLLPPLIIKDILKNKIHEDENILCINKPYNISVQGGTNVSANLTDSLQHILDLKLFIVHRIDKETKGALVLAKNVLTAQKISEMFKNNQIEKEYFAIVSPIPKKDEDTINIQIEVDDVKKDSSTEYKILQKNPENDTAILLVKPKTGRKHQIRIHLSKIGSPIIGDKKYYGNTKICKELQLYANKIIIPEFGTFEADFNPDILFKKIH